MYDFLYLENNWLPYSTCVLLVLAPISLNMTFIRYFCFDLRSVRLRLSHNLPLVAIRQPRPMQWPQDLGITSEGVNREQNEGLCNKTNRISGYLSMFGSCFYCTWWR